MQRSRSYMCAIIVAGAAVLACAGDGDQQLSPTEVSAARVAVNPTASATAAPTARTDGLIDDLLGQGQPLPLFVCVNNGGPYTDSAVVGLLGGTLRFGPHSLVIPPAALLQRTSITATTYVGDTISVTFKPQGLHFLLPATLSLDYKHCAVQPKSSLQIDYLNDLLTEILSLLPSIDKGQGQVTSLISHFSVYAASETRR